MFHEHTKYIELDGYQVEGWKAIRKVWDLVNSRVAFEVGNGTR